MIPDTIEDCCIWCVRVTRLKVLRRHDDGDEYRCPLCGRKIVLKQNDPDVYVFFPADVDRAFLDLGGSPFNGNAF